MSDFDSDLEADSDDETFTNATEHVQRTHAMHMPNDLLELYALYKQATAGRCNTTKPSIFNLQGKAKWSAWHELGDMTATQAKQLYIAKLQKIDPDWAEVLKQGAALKSPNNWVVHSIEMLPEDLEQKAEHEKTAFDYVKEGNLSRLRETLAGVQLHQLDDCGMGLIHWAADRNLCDILQYLLAAGADVNFCDAEQQTALHYAASCGHTDCLRTLLSFNADRLAKDADGHTCIDVAENAEVRSLLEI